MSTFVLATHSPANPTGYGRVARWLAGTLHAAGHRVTCLGSGRQPARGEFPYPVERWPGQSPPGLAAALDRLRPDTLLTVGDPWMFEGVPALPARRALTWVAYFPVDGRPLPDAWRPWVRDVDLPVVFSRFARDVVRAGAGVDPALVYHGVDTAVFRPADKGRAKALAHLDGAFVVGTVARNQVRKNLPALVEGFAAFAKGKGDDVLLYLHTQLKGDYDVPALARRYGVEGRTRTTAALAFDRGVPDEVLATLYNAMDVFVLPTMAEGFGLPVMEAQACGVPALATDFSACPELMPDPVQRLRVETLKIMNRNLDQAFVEPADVAAKLDLLYADRRRLSELGDRCHRFAQAFDWAAVGRQFLAVLAAHRPHPAAGPPTAAFSQRPIRLEPPAAGPAPDVGRR